MEPIDKRILSYHEKNKNVLPLDFVHEYIGEIDSPFVDNVNERYINTIQEQQRVKIQNLFDQKTDENFEKLLRFSDKIEQEIKVGNLDKAIELLEGI